MAPPNPASLDWRMSETQLERFERKFDRFVEYVQGEFAAVRAEFKSEIAEARSEIAEVRSGLAEVRSEVVGLRSDVAELRSEVAGLRSDVAELRSEVAGLRSDVAELRAELRTFRSESQEKFENLSDRLRLIESRLSVLALEQSRIRQTLEHGLNQVRAEIEQLRLKTEAVEAATLDNSLRIIQLRDDIQQRFRIVNERLAAVEKQLAA